MKALCALALVLVGAAPAPALERLHSVTEALRLAYPAAARFTPTDHSLSTGQRQWLATVRHRRAYTDTFQWVRAWDAKDRWLGSALVDAELGKHQPLDYLVALGPDGRVIQVELLVYREAYGGGVRSPRFLAQFKGKGPEAALTLGQDVDAVSGATISSRTLADGVAKALRLFQDLEHPRARP